MRLINFYFFSYVSVNWIILMSSWTSWTEHILLQLNIMLYRATALVCFMVGLMDMQWNSNPNRAKRQWHHISTDAFQSNHPHPGLHKPLWRPTSTLLGHNLLQRPWCCIFFSRTFIIRNPRFSFSLNLLDFRWYHSKIDLLMTLDL